MIQDISDLMKDNSKTELRGFKKSNRCVLARWSRKINCILTHIRTENITDTNVLIKAVVVYLGLKACGSKNKKELEPSWKGRIDKTINEVRKHINILECHQRGEIKKSEKYDEFEKKYNIKKKGIRKVLEELKQRLM